MQSLSSVYDCNFQASAGRLKQSPLPCIYAPWSPQMDGCFFDGAGLLKKFQLERKTRVLPAAMLGLS